MLSMDFPGGTSGKEPACQCRRHKRLRFDPWVGKIPWRRVWQPTPIFLPGESHGQKSLEGESGWGTHVNPWLIHVNIWQKPLQYCKVISLQLIKINEKIIIVKK